MNGEMDCLDVECGYWGVFEGFQGTSAADLFGGVRWTTGCDWIARFYCPIVGCRDRVRFLSQSKLALQVAEEIAISAVNASPFSKDTLRLWEMYKSSTTT